MKTSLRAHRADFLGTALFAVVALALAIRLNRGLDLSDESFYALYLDDWLKGGMHSSAFRSINQTAALLVYPLAYAYREVAGSTDGLVLFLRCVFLTCSITASGFLAIALRRITSRSSAWIAASIFLAFIPFGLPAPSYNTTSIQALCVALAALVCGFTSRSSSATQLWFSASALAWAAVTVAYPPLGISAVLMFMIMLTCFRDHQSRVIRYLTICVIAQVVSWGLIIAKFGLDRLLDIVSFTSSVSEPGDISHRLIGMVNLVRPHHWFVALLSIAIFIGLIRRRIPDWLAAPMVASLIVLTFVQPAALYTRSHDAIALLAMTSLGWLIDLRSRELDDRLRALMYTVSLMAGISIVFFATNSVINFAVGSWIAASLVLASSPVGRRSAVLHLVSGIAVVISMLHMSFTYHYGSDNFPAFANQPETTTSGVFSGIRMHRADAEMLRVFHEDVMPLIENEREIAYVGWNFGVVLESSARLRMLSVYPFQAHYENPPKALATFARYYESRYNRPSVVIIYRDPYFNPANPIGPKFEKWYSKIAAASTPDGGTYSVYRLSA